MERFMVPIIVAITATMQGCATRNIEAPTDRALVLAACPNPTPLADGSFASTTEKLVWYAVNYRKCRAAAGVK